MTLGVIGSSSPWKVSKEDPRGREQRQAAIAMARRTDMVRLAGQYIQLRRKAAGEYEGPCQRCGGQDRFVVDMRGWFCRHCKPFDSAHGWYSPIDFVMWKDGLPFQEAVAFLTGVQLRVPAVKVQPTAKPPPQAQQTDDWRRAAEKIVAAAQSALMASNTPGGDYLERRGIESHTWMAFGMGYGTHKGRQAIVLPWYRAGRLVAVRFRFLASPPEGAKIVSLPGSHFAGTLYGGQARSEIRPQLRTLVVCEGELNAASIWQVAFEAGVEVLSVGSESTTLTDQMAAHAREYRHVIVWMDKPEVAQRMADRLGAKVWANSPAVGGKEYDANDMLCIQKLGHFLTAARARACVTEEDKRDLLERIIGAAELPIGVDAGTGEIGRRIVEVLGTQVEWEIGEDGQWRVLG